MSTVRVLYANKNNSKRLRGKCTQFKTETNGGK